VVRVENLEEASLPEPLDPFNDHIARADALLKAIPGVEAVLQNASDPEEAVKAILEIVAKNENQLLALLDAANGFSNSISEFLGNGPSPIIRDSNGTVRWNPLIEAGILERAHIDGDVPEFRQGPLPEGAVPAIPVRTASTDPVYVGLQLKKTSQKALVMFSEAKEEHAALCLRMQEEHLALNPLVKIEDDFFPPAPSGVEGYEAGQVPVLWDPEPVSLQEIKNLTEDETSSMVWLSVATTQGRRSLAPVLEQALIEKIRGTGVQAEAGSRKTRPDHAIEEIWTYQAFGPMDLEPNFNPVASALSAFFQAFKENASGRSFLVNVEPLSGTADRRFGWALYYWRNDD